MRLTFLLKVGYAGFCTNMRSISAVALKIIFQNIIPLPGGRPEKINFLKGGQCECDGSDAMMTFMSILAGPVSCLLLLMADLSTCCIHPCVISGNSS
jgi:hypothetical protein